MSLEWKLCDKRCGHHPTYKIGYIGDITWPYSLAGNAHIAPANPGLRAYAILSK